MKKQKWTEKPVTWGGYAKLCVVCYVVSAIYCTIYYIAVLRPSLWNGFKEFVKKPFTRKPREE